jgi:hypothetical protein
MLTPVQQHAIERFAKGLLTLADDSLIDAYHQAWEETPVPRTATTSTKLAPRVSRLRRRCRVAFRIINAATSSGTREPARHPFPGARCPGAGRRRRRARRYALPRILRGQKPGRSVSGADVNQLNRWLQCGRCSPLSKSRARRQSHWPNSLTCRVVISRVSRQGSAAAHPDARLKILSPARAGQRASSSASDRARCQKVG